MQTAGNNEDENLAKQMFCIGCFGLPWLWLVNCAYFYSAVRTDRASSGLKKWFYMSLAGSLICFTALFVWIITFQLSWRHWEGAKSYMIYVPEEDRNDW
mmetsp:Transcript_6769/g.10188  ORF Transcript_6769/g.10188 Transcript_6769/m.10188 type:complete len:99 (+) Transcript_6769:97-393(+)